MSKSSISGSSIPLLIVAAITCQACGTVGTGKKLVVKSQCAYKSDTCNFLTDRFGAYVSPSPGETYFVGPRSRLQTKPPSHLTLGNIRSYLQRVYGSYSPSHVLDLGFNIKDRIQTPPYAAVDYRSKLLGLLAGAKTPKPEDFQKTVRRLGLLPDLVRSTAPHHTENGQVVYYYYPRLSIDFTAALRGVVPPDRLGALFFVVRIKSCETPKGERDQDRIRFLDFSPKVSDIAEFTRGELNNSANANLNASVTEADSTTVADKVGDTTTTTVDGRTPTNGLSIAFSESLTRSLVDALERRSAGIFDDGQTFLATMRGLRDKKLAGTYNFDFMLEVPSDLVKMGNFMLSKPVSNQVVADVMMIGVVRHVIKRGRTGWISHAPENENDHTIDQVVVAEFPDRVLWRHDGEDWFDPIPYQQTPTCSLTVTSNRKDATYSIEQSNEIIAVGPKAKQEMHGIKPDSPGSRQCTVKVHFHDVVVVEKGTRTVLRALPVSKTLSTNNKSFIVGVYQ